MKRELKLYTWQDHISPVEKIDPINGDSETLNGTTPRSYKIFTVQSPSIGKLGLRIVTKPEPLPDLRRSGPVSTSTFLFSGSMRAPL